MTIQTDKRSSDRSPCHENIKYILSEKDAGNRNQELTAQVIDISATGMGISTAAKLEKGQIIHFVQPQPKWSLPDRGVIVWTLRLDDCYRAGLEFML